MRRLVKIDTVDTIRVARLLDDDSYDAGSRRTVKAHVSLDVFSAYKRWLSHDATPKTMRSEY